MTGKIIIENTNFRKIERKIKRAYRYSGRVRERNMCPNCNSLDIRKRVTTKDYRCRNCDWIGNRIGKIMA